jgi:uncharacterized protein
MATIRDRLDWLDWSRIEASLWARGYAKTPPLLTPEECRALIDLYKEDARFRSRIEMARHRFGEGEYKYFKYPLPEPVQKLRVHAYPRLAVVANQWTDALRQSNRYPRRLTAFLDFCHDHGQTKPTPLLLRYGPGGYNCLHQDLYGDIAFPLQLTVFLSPSDDYIGGQFLLLEQRPRAQSRGEAISTEQGEAVIFTTRSRPVSGKRGYFRVNMRHGVSTVHAGSRFTLGIIFHDAR